MTTTSSAATQSKWLTIVCKRLSTCKSILKELEHQARQLHQEERETLYLELLSLPLAPSVISQASINAFSNASPATAVKLLTHPNLTKTQVNKTIAILFQSTDKLSTGHALAAFFNNLDELPTFDFESAALHAINELVDNGRYSFKHAVCQNALLFIFSNKPKVTKRLQSAINSNFLSIKSNCPELLSKLTDAGFTLPTT